MADFFRGLTIRLGADVRPLNSALGTVRSQAGQVQRELNKMSKALKFNPNDASVMASRIGLMNDRLKLAAQSSRMMETAFKQVGAKTRMLADGAKGTYSAVARLRNEYNGVNGELETLYDAMARVKAKSDSITFEKAREDVRKLARNLDSVKEKTRTAARNKLWGYALSLSNSGSLPLGISGIGSAGADNALDVLNRLRTSQKNLNASLEEMKSAQGFETLKYEASAAKAEVMEAATQLARFKSELFAAGESGTALNETTQKLRSMEGIIEANREKMHAMSEAYKGLPKSVEAATGKMRSTMRYMSSLKEAVSTLRDRIKAIESVNGFDKQAAQMKDVNAEVAKAESRFASLKAEMEETEASARQLEQKMNRLQEASNGAYGRSSAFKKDKEELDEYIRKLDKLESEIKQADAALENANMEREWVEAKDAVVRYESELDKLNSKQSRLAAMGNVGKSIKNVGYAAYSTLTPAIMMGGRYAIQSAEEVDAAYRDMRKTVQGTEADFEHLKDAALDYGRTHVTSADQILSIEAIGGQLGITVDKLEGFSKTVSDLDIATNMDTENIAADLGKMGSVLKMSTEDYSHFGDALVRLGNSEPAFESDIMTIATRFMGVGKVAGMSASEMLAWSTAATATGQKAEAAGSSMQRFVSKMETAVANGGDDLKMYADVAGMSADEFAEKFRGSASDAMYAFIEGLGKMHTSGKSVNQQLTEMGINNVRDKQLLEGLAMQMANATDENNVLKDSLEMSEHAWNGISDKWGDAGDAAREAEKKSQGFSGQLQIMKNNAQALAVELGEGIAPWLERLNGLITAVSGAMSTMPQPMKEAIVAGAALAAAFGPIAVGAGSLLSAFSQISETIHKFPTAFFKLSKGTKAAADGAAAATGNVISFDKATRGADKAAKGAASSAGKAGKAMSSAFSGVGGALKGSLITIGIIAAIAGIAMVAEGYAKLRERQEKFAKSAEATGNLFKDLGKSASDSAKNVDNLSAVLRETASAADDIAQKNIDMASSLSDNLVKVATDSENLDKVTDKILSLGKAAGDSGGLTSNQLNDLKTAINEFNEINGTVYTVDETGKIRDEEGALVDLAKAFDRARDAKKLMWAADAINEAGVKAANNSTEAYKKLQEAEKGLNQLRDMQANPQKYNIDSSYMESIDRQVAAAEANYNELKKEAENADNAKRQLLGASNVMETAAGNAESVEAVIAKFENFPQAFEATGQSAMSFADTLKSLGLEYNDLKSLSADDVKSIVESWDGGVSSLTETLGSYGIKLDDTGAAMSKLAESAGISSDQLSLMYQQAGGNIDTLLSNMQLLSELKVKNKHFTVNDDGTISVNKKELGNLDYIKVGDKLFKVDDNGTLTYTSKKADEVKGKVGSIPSSKTIGVYADTTQANSALDNVLARFAAAASKNFIIRAKAVFDERYNKGATGTFTDFPITRAIPAHAAGGITGIVTQPTMTNWGLVGEAGAEALVRWAHGTAVVPLENHRYVRPFAQTIASEMGGVGSTSITNVYLNDVLINSVPALQQATEDYLSTIARYTAMGGK